MLYVNEEPMDFKEGLSPSDFIAAVKPGADIFIINGFPVEPDTELKDGDSCWLIKRGERPSAREMNRLLYARHSPGVQGKIAKASVGIMGLGGLGSVVAVALARIGVGHLLLADFDVVEPSNLNRQQYFIDQIGLLKTTALKENLTRINPYITVNTIQEKLTEESIPVLFKEVNALAECFDAADMKAAALRAVLTKLNGVGYVTTSGIAGYGANNTITTKKLYPNVYLVGDGESAAGQGHGLMAPRVGIAAHHQANKILQILLNHIN